MGEQRQQAARLHEMGVPIEGPTHVFCNNEAVYKNSSTAHSTLKKKHNSICFHPVRECVAACIQVVHKVDTADNLSDILTKSLLAHIRKNLQSLIMYIRN